MTINNDNAHNQNMKDIFKLLKEAKERSGKSYNDIANEVGDGASAPAIANIFGGRRSVSIKTLDKIFTSIGADKKQIKAVYLTIEKMRLEKRIEQVNKELKTLGNK